MFPTGPGLSDVKMSERETPIDEMRAEIKMARRKLAFKLRDYFNALEQLSETEFLEVVAELDGDGITISQMVEKHKRYKRGE